MRKIKISSMLILVFFFSGCTINANRPSRSASDVFFGIAEGVLEIFEENEFDDFRRRNRKNLEARKKWQRENL